MKLYPTAQIPVFYLRLKHIIENELALLLFQWSHVALEVTAAVTSTPEQRTFATFQRLRGVKAIKGGVHVACH